MSEKLSHTQERHFEATGVTLLTWNTLNNNSGPDIVSHLSSVSTARGGIDIFCLQEVPIQEPGNAEALPELVMDSLQAQGTVVTEHHFRRHIGPVEWEGIATFSKPPILSEKCIELSEKDPIMNLMTTSNRRVCLRTEHALRGWRDPLTVVNTHLSFISIFNKSQRVDEMDRIVDICRSQEENMLMVGDLNVEPDARLIKAISEHLRPLSDLEAPTHLSRRLLGRYAVWKTHDYIFATPDLTGTVSKEDCGPSDHNPLVAEVTKR